MIHKIIFAAIPFLSVLAPVCSTPFTSNLSVFASMMSDNPYRPKNPTGATAIDQKEVHFDEAMRVMSFNILSDDHLEHAWEKRKASVVSMIRFHHADLIGLQEASHEQLTDLAASLPEYNAFAGNYNPILFRKSRFQLVSSGSFFLSPTPNTLSVGWDAKFPRAANWVKLHDKKMGKEFVFFNTHFDYHGSVARNGSAALIQLKALEIAGNSPVILAGDFNLFPDLGGDQTYKLLTTSFLDALVSAQFPHHGPTGTWSGFKEAGQPGIRPDCIFVSPKVEVFLHGILSDTFDGQFPSDHLPVVADLAIH